MSFGLQPFRGRSVALSDGGIAGAGGVLGVAPAEIWTVLTVETQGCGFLRDCRPVVLFERHVFSRLTQGRYDICDIGNPQPGGYGASGAHQHDRLAQAVALDRAAALKSASWGLPQIMGECYAEAGFANVEDMVAALCDSEDAQVAAFAAFLRSKRLDGCLRAHDWSALARGYNGPNYAANRYDTKLAAAYAQYAAGPLPDLRVRTAQLYLGYGGLDAGQPDGLMGPRTRQALSAFQQQNGLPATAAADEATLAALTAAVLAGA